MILVFVVIGTENKKSNNPQYCVEKNIMSSKGFRKNKLLKCYANRLSETHLVNIISRDYLTIYIYI